MIASAAPLAPSYEAALERLAALQARDDEEPLRPDSGTLAFLHGERRARAILLLHGMTNGPLQFAELGRQLYAAGYNVLIPRLPGHGYRDRLTEVLATLTPAALAATADEALGIAAGLGEQLQLGGISLGGVLAGWLAQQQPVERALLIAPLIGIQAIPQRLSRAAVALAQRLPNRFIWWDPRVREAIPGPDYAYPRVPTRALGAGLWFGVDLLRRARLAAPATASLAVATAWGDPAVNGGAIAALVRAWQAQGATVTSYRFGPDEVPNLTHDIVDPLQPTARVEQVYPVLMRLLDA